MSGAAGSLDYRNKLVLSTKGPELQNVIVAIAGRKGSGKSTLTREILQHSERLFVFDTMGEHSWIPDKFTSLDEAWAYICERAGDLAQNFIGSFIPEDAQEDALQSSFAEICNAAYECGNMSIAVEELPMMSSPNWVPPAFDRLIRLGRHRSVNVLYTGQRLSECPRRVTSATDIFILFSHTEPRDIDAIAERCSPDVALRVTQLDSHEFLVFDVRARSLLTVDSRWYDAVLNAARPWTPAIGGKSGRRLLWSIPENA